MMGESCVRLESKDIRVFGSFRPFFKIFKSKLGYSRITIDLLSLHVLYSSQFKIGVHLLNDELTQLLTLVPVHEK